MINLQQRLADRKAETDAYLDLLAELDDLVRTSRVRRLEPRHHQLAKAGFYLQLYNLVESVVSDCVEAVCTAITSGGCWVPADLEPKLFEEWVRSTAQTSEDLNKDHRRQRTVDVARHAALGRPIERLKLEVGGGGNWDDREIDKLAKRLGVTLRLPRGILNSVGRHEWNEKGVLQALRAMRNGLAHGSMAFSACAEDSTMEDLRRWHGVVCDYLEVVVRAFDTWITSHGWLIADRRPS